MNSKLNEQLKLYLVTDEKDSTEILLQKVEAAIKGGTTMVQLREKNMLGGQFYEKALKLKQLLNAYNIPLIINDRVDIALAVGADGVHVGQKDIPADVVRKMIPRDMILGVSAATVFDAEAAIRAGADYLGVGAIFPTGSKSDAKEIEKEMLKEIVSLSQIPVVAIGGISTNNVYKLADTGIAGVSVISAILHHPNPQGQATTLRKMIESL